MILQNIEPYVKTYLHSEWSDFWDVHYNEKEDRIECVWNGEDSTRIEFTYDCENENLLFSSNEPQPVETLIEMLEYLNEKAYEILEQLDVQNKKQESSEDRDIGEFNFD